MQLADAGAEAAGHAHAKIGERIAPEIVAKVEDASIAARLPPVDLQTRRLAPGAPDMPPTGLAQQRRVTEPVLRAVDRQPGARTQLFDYRADRHRRPDGVRLGNKQRPQTVEASGNIGG